MSETENNTEEKAETVNTAPYMKKPGENKVESTSSNMIVPTALVLVSAIVIGVTFYGDKDKAPLTQAETPNLETADIKITTETETANTEASAIPEPVASKAETSTEKSNSQTEATETNEQNIVAETEAVPAVSEAVIISEEKVAVVVTPQTPAASHMAATRPAPVSYQYNQYRRQQMPARTKQHMEMLQKRRQAYEREMQNRRAQYETAMKARQEKRSKIAEAKKAVFQRVQKDRLAAEQKIQEIHKQIAKLHEEIHQIMRESRGHASPTQMHSM